MRRRCLLLCPARRCRGDEPEVRTDPMIKINTMHIGDLPLAVDGEEKGDFLELDREAYPRACGPVQYHLSATMAGNDLLVTGSVKAKIAAECARCLKPLKVNVSIPDVCHLYEGVAGQVVDISNEIREDVLLTLPVAFHCSESCRGLCPKCGANLNEHPCSCCSQEEPPPADSPWGALDELKF